MDQKKDSSSEDLLKPDSASKQVNGKIILVKVTRDGKAIVRISPLLAGKSILHQLNNQTIEMYVFSRNYEPVNFTVIEYNNETA